MKTKSYHKYIDNNGRDDKATFREKLKYLKEAVDVHYLLESLGVSIGRETTKEIRGTCPVHQGDNTTAFRFNKDTRTWVCFTHKCHEQYNNDIIGLIQALISVDFKGAVDYLKQLTGDIDAESFKESKRRREMDEFVNSHERVIMKPKSVNEKSLSKFKTLRSNYFLNKGFKSSTLEHFEIGGGWKDSHDLIRDIIPIRNDRGELIAYSLRDIREDVDYDSKYILTPGFDKDNCLYNLNVAQNYGIKAPIIVVEGFKSVWRLHELGINNVVATMGSGVSPGQQMLLCLHAIRGIVMFYDNDLAGVKGSNQAYKDLSDKLEVRPVFIQEVDENGKGLDPADLTDDQVYDYLDTYFIKEEV